MYDKRDAFYHQSVGMPLFPAQVDPIKLTIKPGSPIINKQQYQNFSVKQKKIIHEQLDTWVQQGVADYFPSNELCFISPLVLVESDETKPNRKYRLCLNLKALNNMVVSLQAQVPNIHQLVQILGSSNNTMYHSIDLANSYLQLPVHQDTRKWLCVRDPLTNQILCMNRLPFGLINSGFFLIQVVNTAFQDLFLSMPLTAYVDDLACASNPSTFITDLRTILDRLIQYGLKANPAKTRLCQPKLEYLGFSINTTRVLAIPI